MYFRDQKSLIEKDVNRTDRKRLFYEGNENISLKMLFDVLVTYVMYNFDLGKAPQEIVIVCIAARLMRLVFPADLFSILMMFKLKTMPL